MHLRSSVLLALCCSLFSCKEDETWEPFVDTAYEPNNTRSTAYSLGAGAGDYAASGYITGGDIDWFSVQIDAGSTLHLDWADGFAVQTYDPAGVYVPPDRYGEIDILTTGTYYLKVYASGGGSVHTIYGFTLQGGKAPGPYTLKFSVVTPITPAENDMGTAVDAGNDKLSATTPALMFGGGRLTPTTDTEDWYVIPVIGGKKVTVSLTPPADSDYDLQVHTPGGSIINPPEGGIGGEERVPYPVLVDGNLWIRVSLVSGQGIYQLSITVQ